MSSHVLSKDKATFVKGIIFYGFPLHAAGQPSISRADHLKSITVPMLFLQGTRDALAQLPLIQEVTGQLPLAKLVAFEGADHSFKAGKKDIIPELVETTASWTTTVLDS